MTEKTRVAVLYGGRSGEHEVSLQSAASVVRHLDRTRFEVIPVSIDKAGRWQRHDLRRIEQTGDPALAIPPESPEVRLAQGADGRAGLVPLSGDQGRTEIDVVFPVLHGPLCEDGTLQGLLELTETAYVGSGVLASAVGMDKDVAKRLAGLAGIPVAPYRAFTRKAYERGAVSLDDIAASLTLPVFVKPCNMGSSVGIRKVKDWADLPAALADAFQYDVKVLVEQGIDAREIEVAVLDGDPPFVSVASELNPQPHHDFYSYAAKYLDPDGATVDLPARLAPEPMARVRALALQAFEALECSGLARVDFFLDRTSGEFYLNEINTLPGFTAISMYPKMMEASGVPYPELLTRLVALALERHRVRRGLRREFVG
ncbi:D-alanine--D-alanine ligase family protein [Methylobacterium nonmethylotrophicum]|uniref:D-alanine--D-alanine ligase n=1 Tax=Methylobacterium nonmethylotrophicum TaxID=1141884 RepID=A0A4Z0NXP3_9HYPH|nr:D-alanine--D-alanine ligase family protein [Methylobacterium nonmethylotrophicum]TGE02254.1 D-alanine--D-alanine ligase [Methylobacterium nonmethylotrophicum]